MRIGCLVFIVWLCWAASLQAQDASVLMRVNGQNVSLAEFERACQSHPVLTTDGSSSLQVQLDWFVTQKLKALAAEADGLDTLPEVQTLLYRYRNDLLCTCLTDANEALQAARLRYKRLESQPHSGEVWISHIFRRLPQDIPDATLQQAETQMDSIYNALCEGVDFNALVQQYSDEKSPLCVKRLQEATEFEEAVFACKPGEFTPPFFTPQGIHIVRVLKQEPLPPFEKLKDSLMRKQARLHCNAPITRSVVKRLKTDLHFCPDDAGMNELRKKGYTGLPLFTLDGKNYTGTTFALFAAAYPAGLEQQIEAFITKSLLDHANIEFEQKHPNMSICLQIHRDSLLADLWETKNGGSINQDEQQLQIYFERNRDNYRWKHPHYYGIVLHAVSKRTMRQARKFLKGLPEKEWTDALRIIFPPEQTEVRAEMGVFALGDNKFVDDLVFKQGNAAPLPDYPFATVVGKKRKSPKSYRDVYNEVAKDYKRDAEKSRLSYLYAQSKVEINQEVLKTVNNKRVE